ncbi:MAG: hypothetical protein QOK40_11 [Miltoncostaeaceae bacterium]|nr:hypothetical protein [Miltoncostaeaceae bacterium]
MSDEVSQFVGVDWSGADADAAQRAAIWLAVVRDGELCELTPRLTRVEAVERVAALAGLHPRTVVGLDFAFSLPRWWLAEQGFAAADELWRWAAARAEADRNGWLRQLPDPFWGTRLRLRPTRAFSAGRPELRVTEREARDAGARPMSAFRLFGPGTVGAQGLRGHPCLLRLQDAGFSIWPFEAPAWPLVVEVSPRLLARQLAPALARLRAATLRAAFVEAAPLGFTGADAEHAEALRANGDAFDAAVAAWALWHGRATLAFLPLEEPVEDYRLEGRIWRLPDEALQAGSPVAQWQVPDPASVNDFPATGRNLQS